TISGPTRFSTGIFDSSSTTIGHSDRSTSMEAADVCSVLVGVTRRIIPLSLLTSLVQSTFVCRPKQQTPSYHRPSRAFPIAESSAKSGKHRVVLMHRSSPHRLRENCERRMVGSANGGEATFHRTLKKRWHSY